MARLRNVTTGVIVSVRDGKEMGSEWVPVVEVEAKQPPPPRRPARKPDNK